MYIVLPGTYVAVYSYNLKSSRLFSIREKRNDFSQSQILRHRSIPRAADAASILTFEWCALLHQSHSHTSTDAIHLPSL
jgi:hypothetical protein